MRYPPAPGGQLLRAGYLFYIVGHMTLSALGELELAVLLAVVRLGGDAYSLRIRHEVSAVREHDYSVGAIHTTLQRLEGKGYARSSMTEPLPVRGGRSRRQYEVTAAGRHALRDAQARAARLWGAADLRGRPA